MARKYPALMGYTQTGSAVKSEQEKLKEMHIET
jgi:hypothetical protein